MHVMLDLETMGTGPNAPIVAIGACRFNETDGVTDTFYKTISLKSAVDNGAEMDADTVIWWLQQGDDARGQITAASGHMLDALDDFRKWIAEAEISGVWGNGVSFDNALLTQTYRRNSQDAPWSYRLDRCYRTLKSLTSVTIDQMGTHHNALDDAVSQANHLLAIWAAA